MCYLQIILQYQCTNKFINFCGLFQHRHSYFSQKNLLNSTQYLGLFPTITYSILDFNVRDLVSIIYGFLEVDLQSCDKNGEVLSLPTFQNFKILRNPGTHTEKATENMYLTLKLLGMQLHIQRTEFEPFYPMCWLACDLPFG